MKIKDSFECVGEWWLKDDIDNKLSGMMKYSPEMGVELRTKDSFQAWPKPAEGIIICGDTTAGYVTLVGCKSAGVGSKGGAVWEKFRASYAIVGIYYELDDAENTVLFSKVEVEFSNVGTWPGMIRFSLLEDPPTNREAAVFQVASGSYKLTIGQVVNNNATVDQKTHSLTTGFVIEPDSPMSFEALNNSIIKPLANFLSLATNDHVRMISMKARADLSEEQQHPSFLIFYFTTKYESFSLTRHDYQYLFKLPDVRDVLAEWLNEWHQKTDQLRKVSDLYFGLLNIQDMYLRVEFATLTQVLETYHRDQHGGHYLSEAAYKSIEKALVDAIPSGTDQGLRESLKSTVRYGYGYSLRKRIKLILTEVLAKYSPTVEKIVENIGPFTNQVTDTRNYFTHYTDELEEKAILVPAELQELTDKLRKIVQLCFLHEIGADHEKVEKFYSEKK